jgi:hypothetical protein
MLKSPEVGAIIDQVGRDTVLFSMTSQKNDRLTEEVSMQQTAGWLSIGRCFVTCTGLLESVQIVHC